jgi:glucose uptake protein
MFIFAVGVFVSNFLFNTIAMRRPVEGEPVSVRAYFAGGIRTHMVGVLGGLIWGLGNAFNLIAAGKAGAAISYGLGQGATMIAALWGVFVWKEFRGGGKIVSNLLTLMFILFLAGIGLIIAAGN